MQAAHLADRGDRRGAREGIATERRRVRALWELAHRARECDRTHWHSASDGLREAEQVRCDAVLLEREHRAGAAEAGLHLVDDQEDAALAAEPRGLGDELMRGGTHAAFALHELDDERRGLRGD